MIKYLKPLKSENGFSVVEMMAAVVIAGLIMGAVGTFLMIHIKSFETTVDVIDSQFEAQLALNAIGEVAMESQQIGHVFGGGTVYTISNSTVVDPEVLGFVNGDGSFTVFYYEKSNARLIFKDLPKGTVNPYTIGTIPTPYNMKDQDLWFDFAYNIHSWTISPGVGTTVPRYESTNNMYIYMDVVDGGAQVRVSNLFKFRNKR